jgi:hypothetical protein
VLLHPQLCELASCAELFTLSCALYFFLQWVHSARTVCICMPALLCPPWVIGHF